MSISISVEVKNHALAGILKKQAEKILDDIDKHVGVAITVAQRETVRWWPVDTGYSRASITSPERIERGAWQFRIEADYARIIEYGGYRSVGPKTQQQSGETLPGGIQIGSGIYTRPSAPMRRGMAQGLRKLKELTG
jgi:hypothetical protein